MTSNVVSFIDLFAGLGGIRLGFEQACNENSLTSKCVMTSEVKSHAIETLKQNFHHENFVGDIFNIKNEDIPDFDILLAGFPCQPFSSSGKRHGFADTRGTLFFEIERILRHKKPTGFILENVEGLVKHDLVNKNDDIGRTFATIIDKLENDLGYKVSWKVLDSINFGVPQSRKRVFIVGTQTIKVNLEIPNSKIQEPKLLKDILENGLDTLSSKLIKQLLSHYPIKDLYGKSLKDKRGGDNNIHSWDIGVKGECSKQQITLLNKLFKERRKKQWAADIGIDWMDGMPLTLSQIETFYNPTDLFESYNLERILDDLVARGYLRFEHPKKLVVKETKDGNQTMRVYDETKPKGYNIVTGKLSFEISKILNPMDIAPTLVATDMAKIAVPDGHGLRKLTKREGLRLFGYPESYKISVNETKAFDLLGNTVVVPVVKSVSKQLIDECYRFLPVF